MLDLEFFKKKFSEKIFCSKIHFYQMLITFPLFFGSYWGGGWGELANGVFNLSEMNTTCQNMQNYLVLCIFNL